MSDCNSWKPAPCGSLSGCRKNGRGDENDINRRAEVRLHEDQTDANENRADSRKNIVKKVFFREFQVRRALAFQVKEPREIQDHGELGDFRWLNADRTETNPAMRGV